MFEVTADQNVQAFHYVTTMLIPITSGSRNPDSFRKEYYNPTPLI